MNSILKTNEKKTIRLVAVICLVAISCSVSAQTWKWATGSSCPHGVMETFPIAVDGTGNVYEIGEVYAQPGFMGPLIATFGAISVIDSGIGTLISTDSNGAYRWVIPVTNGTAWFNCITTDPYDNVYVVGVCSTHFTFGSKSFTGPAGSCFCIKVDAAGNVLWIKSIAAHLNIINSISANSSGNIYIAGLFGGGSTATTSVTIGATTLTNTDPTGWTADVFFAKLDSSGNPLWAKSFGGTMQENQRAFALTNDSEIYVAGWFKSPSVTIGSTTLVAPGWPCPFYVAKFDGSGNPLWAKAIPANDTFQAINSMTTDPVGSVYITGRYSHDFSFGTDTLPVPVYFYMFLAKYDSAGNAKWGKTIPDQRFFEGCSAAADACGNIWVSGISLSFTNIDQFFLAEYDSAGHIEDTLVLSEGGDDASAIVVDNKGNLIIGGDYLRSPSIFGHDTMTFADSSGEALFVLKYMYATAECMPGSTTLQTGVVTTPAMPALSLFPNPASGAYTIHSDAAFTAYSRVDIYDITGRFIRTYSLNGNNITIPLSGFTQGVYTCRIYNSGHFMETKKLVVMK